MEELEKIVNEKIEKNSEKGRKCLKRGYISLGIAGGCALALNHPEIMSYVYVISALGALGYSLSQIAGSISSDIKDCYLNSMLKKEGK